MPQSRLFHWLEPQQRPRSNVSKFASQMEGVVCISGTALGIDVSAKWWPQNEEPLTYSADQNLVGCKAELVRASANVFWD
jgi:hypothetical protein